MSAMIPTSVTNQYNHFFINVIQSIVFVSILTVVIHVIAKTVIQKSAIFAMISMR